MLRLWEVGYLFSQLGKILPCPGLGFNGEQQWRVAADLMKRMEKGDFRVQPVHINPNVDFSVV